MTHLSSITLITSSSSCHPTIHLDYLPGHEPRLVAAQKYNDIGNVLRRPKTTAWHGCLHRLDHCVAFTSPEVLTVNGTGCDSIDIDLPASEVSS
jgi:hypothetical protein